MSVDADNLRLRDMLERAQRIVAYVQNRSEADFRADVSFQDSVLHCFLIMGEAAAKISEPTQNRNPQLPWRQVIGIRNHIVHGYTKLDLGIVWRTAQEDVPGLIEALLRIIPPEHI